MIKSAASAASLRGGRASGRLDHGLFCSQLLAASAQPTKNICRKKHNFQAVIKSAASAASPKNQNKSMRHAWHMCQGPNMFDQKNAEKSMFFAFWGLLHRDSTQKVIQDHPSTLGLAGGARGCAPRLLPASRSRCPGATARLPCKSREAALAADLSLIHI